MSTYKILNGHVELADNTQVQRATEDAVWLSALLPLGGRGNACKQTLLDVGAGAGAVGLSALHKDPHISSVCFVENNQQACACLQKSIALNGACKKSRTFQQDVFSDKDLGESFDIVLSNPPYYLAEDGHGSHKSSKCHAHYISKNHLKEWVAFCLNHVSTNGHVGLVLHVHSYAEIQNMLADFSVQAVYMHACRQTAKRVLVYVSTGEGTQMEEYVLDTQNKDTRTAVLRHGKPIWGYVNKL